MEEDDDLNAETFGDDALDDTGLDALPDFFKMGGGSAQPQAQKQVSAPLEEDDDLDFGFDFGVDIPDAVFGDELAEITGEATNAAAWRAQMRAEPPSSHAASTMDESAAIQRALGMIGLEDDGVPTPAPETRAPISQPAMPAPSMHHAPPPVPHGLLHPHMEAHLQQQLQQMQMMASTAPGGIIPPGLRAQMQHVSDTLRHHYAALHVWQHQQMAAAAHAQAQQQAAAARMSATTGAKPAEIPTVAPPKPTEVRQPAVAPTTTTPAPKPADSTVSTRPTAGGAQKPGVKIAAAFPDTAPVTVLARPQQQTTAAATTTTATTVTTGGKAAEVPPTRTTAPGENVWNARKQQQHVPKTKQAETTVESKSDVAPHTPSKGSDVPPAAGPSKILSRPVLNNNNNKAEAVGPKILRRPETGAGSAAQQQQQQQRPVTEGHLQAMPKREMDDSITLARVLGRWVPRHARGRYMSHDDILKVARMLYHGIASAGDPFVECYYQFALHAKRSAQQAAVSSSEAGSATPGGDTSNAFDAVAMLTNIGATAAAKRGGKQQADKKSGAATTAGTATSATAAAGSTGPSSSGKDAAATLAAHVMSTLPTGEVRKRKDFRKAHATKLRQWEQHNNVLGRIVTQSTRSMRQALNLSDTGVTTADDIHEGQDGSRATLNATSDDGADPERAEASSVWAARQRIGAVLDAILLLQDAARQLQAMLRTYPPLPHEQLDAPRKSVAELRTHLTELLGLAGETALIDDDAILALLSFPKGKRAVVRALPMIAADKKILAVAAGLRHLPNFVASADGTVEAEEADAALAKRLADWTRTVAVDKPEKELPVLNAWMQELANSHSGVIIRALLSHPVGADIISNVLRRGEAAVAALADGAAQESVATWRQLTERVGNLYAEAE